ncbi:hypothetical protein PVA38_10135 [Streptococcus pneumoniae D39]|nr:hypothetical protein PVA38_10135 [Streptococcus pneumoniae D39]
MNALNIILFPFSKPVSYTHLRAHETVLDLVCRLLLYNLYIYHTHTPVPSPSTNLTTRHDTLSNTSACYYCIKHNLT